MNSSADEAVVGPSVAKVIVISKFVCGNSMAVLSRRAPVLAGAPPIA